MQLREYRLSDILSLSVLLTIVIGLGGIQGYLVSRHGDQTSHGRELFGAPSFARVAENILEHGRYEQADGKPELARMPVYVAVVAIAKLIAGDYWSYLLLAMQGTLSLLCGLMLNRTAGYLTGSPWIPPLVTVVYASHFALQWEHFALRESVVYEFLIVAFFYLAIEGTRGNVSTRRTVAFMTIICILAYHTRATGVFLVGALVLFILFLPDRARGWRSTVLGFALLAIVVAAAPWQTYHSLARGRIALSATDVGGKNLYKGNAFSYEEITPYIDQDSAPDFINQLTGQFRESNHGPGPGRALTADEYLGELARKDIRADWLRFLRKAVLRVLTYLSPLETPLGSAQLVVKDNKLFLSEYHGNFVGAYGNWIQFSRQMSFFVVLFAIPLGFLGNIKAILSDTRLRPIAVASLGFLLANIAAHAAITAETRYRLYLDPLFLLWAGTSFGHIFLQRKS